VSHAPVAVERPPRPDTREQVRQATLEAYRVLDSDPEPEFDALVRAAADVAGVPTALVSLIDRDRQWFKARLEMGICETGRDVAFCDHVVRGGVELLVTDATLDPRFAANPLVTGAPHIRSYAGFPLVAPSGSILGTLCVIGYVAHELDEVRLRILRTLADQVMAQLELRRRLLEAEEATVREARLHALHARVSAKLSASHSELTQALDSMPRSITLATIDRDAAGEPVSVRVKWVNAHVRDLLQKPLDQVLDQPMEIAFPRGHEQFGEIYLQVARTGVAAHVPVDWFGGDVIRGSFELSVVPWTENGILIDVVDVTDRRAVEQALRISEQRMRDAQKLAGLGTWNSDLRTGELTGSPLLQDLLGLPSGAELDWDLLSGLVHVDDRERLSAEFDAAYADGSDVTTTFRIVRLGGRVVHVRMCTMIDRDPDGRPTRLWSTTQDVTASQTRELALTEAAHTDALTGILNRRGWELRCDELITAAADTGVPVALAMLDLDHFKALNDTRGHAAGDALLKECGRAWQARTRDIDVLARIGGEEFAVLLHNCDLPTAEHVVDVLRRLVPECITASAGVTAVRAGESIETALQRADEALYRAKSGGRNRSVVAPAP
jgi:diguanylate cyclase (GGDEF)-like protein